mgnify:CR=1 FL=1
MSGSGGFAVSRSHGGDRFYNPPAMRRHRQMILQQQQQQLQHLQRQQQLAQLQRASKSDSAATAATSPDAGNRTDSDDSLPTLSKPSSVRSPSPPIPPAPSVTNLDRFLESVTPFITAHHSSEVKINPGKKRTWFIRKCSWKQTS